MFPYMTFDKCLPMHHQMASVMLLIVEINEISAVRILLVFKKTHDVLY